MEMSLNFLSRWWPFRRLTLKPTATSQDCSSSACNLLPTVSVILVVVSPRNFDAQINSFLAQTWERKELILVTTYECTLPSTPPHYPIKHYTLRDSNPADAKNFAVKKATGEWCLVWHPECHYACQCIEWFMGYRNKLSPVVLANPGVIERVGRVRDAAYWTYPTYSFFRMSPCVYEDESDYNFILQFPKHEVYRSKSRLSLVSHAKI